MDAQRHSDVEVTLQNHLLQVLSRAKANIRDLEEVLLSWVAVNPGPHKSIETILSLHSFHKTIRKRFSSSQKYRHL